MANILIIDDSKTAAAMLRGVIEPLGHTVVHIESFDELPEHVGGAQDPDVVFLDLQLPGLRGEKIGERLRELERRRTGMVIYSSRPREELEAAAKSLGAAAVVEKGSSPFHIQTVVEMLVQDRALSERPPSGSPKPGGETP